MIPPSKRMPRENIGIDFTVQCAKMKKIGGSFWSPAEFHYEKLFVERGIERVEIL